jgi:hypothetical protein
MGCGCHTETETSFIMQIIRIGINRTFYCHLQLSLTRGMRLSYFSISMPCAFLISFTTIIPCNPLSSICLSYLVHYIIFPIFVSLCLFWARQSCKTHAHVFYHLCTWLLLKAEVSFQQCFVPHQSLRDNKKFVLRITVWTSRAN